MRNFFAGLLSASLLALLGCGGDSPKPDNKVPPPGKETKVSKGDDGKAKETKQADGGKEPAPKEPASISAEAFVKEFIDDEKGAEKKYDGEEVTLSGVVEKKSDPKADFVFLKLKGAPDKEGKPIQIHVNFPLAEEENINKLKEGDKVVVKAKVSSGGIGRNGVTLIVGSLVTK